MRRGERLNVERSGKLDAFKAKNSSSSEITIGLDLGDRRHRFCVLDASGEVIEEGTVGNDRHSLAKLAAQFPPGPLAIMEAGAHSPWVSRHLEALGSRVVVSNPRKVWAIYQNGRKSERISLWIGDAPIHFAVRASLLQPPLFFWVHRPVGDDACIYDRRRRVGMCDAVTPNTTNPASQPNPTRTADPRSMSQRS